MQHEVGGGSSPIFDSIKPRGVKSSLERIGDGKFPGLDEEQRASRRPTGRGSTGGVRAVVVDDDEGRQQQFIPASSSDDDDAIPAPSSILSDDDDDEDEDEDDDEAPTSG